MFCTIWHIFYLLRDWRTGGGGQRPAHVHSGYAGAAHPDVVHDDRTVGEREAKLGLRYGRFFKRPESKYYKIKQDVTLYRSRNVAM